MRPVHAVALALVLPLASCDTIKSVQNRKLVAAVLLQSPTVKNPQTQVEIPSVVSAQMFFGERQDDGNPNTPPKDQKAPAGLAGATVTLSWLEGGQTQTVTLDAASGKDGTYQTDSTRNAQLHYLAHATYTFSATYGSDVFTGQVEAAEPTEMIQFQSLTPPKTIVSKYDVFPDPFTITRALPAGTTDVDIGFYAAYPISTDTQLDPSKITCKNTPALDQPLALLQLVFDPSPWKKDHFDLYKNDDPAGKANCFPSAQNYVVALTTVKKGTPSSNLFLGSAILAGTADAGALVLQP